MCGQKVRKASYKHFHLGDKLPLLMYSIPWMVGSQNQDKFLKCHVLVRKNRAGCTASLAFVWRPQSLETLIFEGLRTKNIVQIIIILFKVEQRIVMQTFAEMQDESRVCRARRGHD